MKRNEWKTNKQTNKQNKTNTTNTKKNQTKQTEREHSATNKQTNKQQPQTNTNKQTNKQTQDFTIGVIICYDVEFPETVRTLALEGADLVVVPTALIGSFNAL